MQQPATFARGGSTKMFGKQAAGPDKPGKDQTSAPGAKRAVGGPRLPGVSAALPAKPGRTGPGKRT
jgi:hypothetical protein